MNIADKKSFIIVQRIQVHYFQHIWPVKYQRITCLNNNLYENVMKRNKNKTIGIVAKDDKND